MLKIKRSALKHKIRETGRVKVEDIYHAVNHPLYLEPNFVESEVDPTDQVDLLIGVTHDGIILELFINNLLNGEQPEVFHAMLCREKFYAHIDPFNH